MLRLYRLQQQRHALLHETGRLEAYTTISVGEFDKWGAWALDGARSAAAWIAKKGHLSKAEARRLVRRGRALDHLPASKQAWPASAAC